MALRYAYFSACTAKKAAAGGDEGEGEEGEEGEGDEEAKAEEEPAEEEEVNLEMTPKTLDKRVGDLTESITY